MSSEKNEKRNKRKKDIATRFPPWSLAAYIMRGIYRGSLKCPLPAKKRKKGKENISWPKWGMHLGSYSTV